MKKAQSARPLHMKGGMLEELKQRHRPSFKKKNAVEMKQKENADPDRTDWTERKFKNVNCQISRRSIW